MTQRTTKETMSEERRKRLNSIGFTWKIRATPIRVDWEVRFQQLVDYKRVHRHCIVPQHYKANRHLGRWVHYQRTKKETMSENRRNQLNSIGFVWRLKTRRPKQQPRVRPSTVEDPKKKKARSDKEAWEVRFQQLVEYKRIHGNCNVPCKYNANPQLGSWVNSQGTKEETMSEERREKLNSIGFTWKGRQGLIPVDWEIRFKQLLDYKRIHGNCNVPGVYKSFPQLGSWVAAQRQSKETMSENRRNQLNSIGFVWRLKTRRPKQQPRVRPSTVEDPKKKKARLDEEAAQEDTVYGQQGWDSYFEQLRDFVRKYNHCKVPAQHPELGRWAEEQQQLYERKQIGRGRESNLTDEQEAKLMAVGFVFYKP